MGKIRPMIDNPCLETKPEDFRQNPKNFPT